jgi:hypothetical protein
MGAEVIINENYSVQKKNRRSLLLDSKAIGSKTFNAIKSTSNSAGNFLSV